MMVRYDRVMSKTQPSVMTDCLIPAPPETLSIDFANTLYWRGADAPTETLGTLDDLVTWCREQAGVPIGLAEACRIRERGEEPATLARALALREALYRLFHAQAEQREPHADDLALLGGFLAEAAPRVALARIDGAYGWRIGGMGATLAALLSPVLWSAIDLLGGARLAKVKRCANDACQWLFIDDSKNGSRRWCSMSSCGNRAKAYRHYHKAE
ncbi:ABATE domain-containing protein [Burkholderia sp. BCC1644]|uniref:CGNR zinc finger domain-containing protein n=1 Tax=Burkholderia sp. BCC1644 TaxID=2676293 RepID=UPI00159036A3|nr:ABATE domain-containing protein [Burkholderia sp. BCC1644]